MNPPATISKPKEKTIYARAWRAKNSQHWREYKTRWNKQNRDKINCRKRLLALRDAFVRAITRNKQ